MCPSLHLSPKCLVNIKIEFYLINCVHRCPGDFPILTQDTDSVGRILVVVSLSNVWFLAYLENLILSTKSWEPCCSNYMKLMS